MSIQTEQQKPKVEVLVGSENDISQLSSGLARIDQFATVRVSVMSCHRNPEELRRFSQEVLTGADVVIACAGKAAALPGIVKSWLSSVSSPVPVIGVALKGETSKDDIAAIESIESLPGQPVELDEHGKAYFGPDGFYWACRAAVETEFLPKMVDAKPAKIGVSIPFLQK